MSKRKGAGIFVIKDQSILLVQRKNNDLWEIPGGESHFQESPEKTARRTLRAETGLQVNQIEPLKIFSGPAHRHVDPNGIVADWTMMIFATMYHMGEPIAGDEINTVRWWPLAALPDNLSEATHGYIEVLQQKISF